MEKRKLTKKEKIVKYILFGLSAVLCVLAIIFTCVKQPIPNSIYKTNTTFEEREAFWNGEYRRLYDNYDASLPLSYFESYIEPRSGIIGQMLYKYSMNGSTNLNLELINNSVNKVTVYSLKVVNKQDSTDFYNVTIDKL